MPSSRARRTAARRSLSAEAAPHPVPPTAPAPNPGRGPAAVGGPGAILTRSVRRGRGHQLRRLDNLGTMTAGHELLHLDDLHNILLRNGRIRKTAVGRILRVAVTPVNR